MGCSESQRTKSIGSGKENFRPQTLQHSTEAGSAGQEGVSALQSRTQGQASTLGAQPHVYLGSVHTLTPVCVSAIRFCLSRVWPPLKD